MPTASSSVIRKYDLSLQSPNLRAFPERQGKVADLALREGQRFGQARLRRRLGAQRIDQRSELGQGGGPRGKQAPGPRVHLGPALELGELDPAKRRIAVRRQRLDRHRLERALLEPQRAHAVVDRNLRIGDGGAEIADRLPRDRARFRGAEDDPAQLDRIVPVPHGPFEVLACEDRVFPFDRVGVLDGVADPDIVDQHGRGHGAGVGAAGEFRARLQEADVGRLGTVQLLAGAQHADRMQRQALVVGDEIDRKLADLLQRRRIVRLDRPVHENGRRRGRAQLGVGQAHEDRPLARRFGHRYRLDPVGHRRAARKRFGRDLHLLDRRPARGRRHARLSERLAAAGPDQDRRDGAQTGTQKDAQTATSPRIGGCD